MHALLVLSMASAATAKMIDIAIGEGGLKFQPDSVTASMGDILRFNWPSSVPHNVVSGDYSKACQPNGLIASPVEMDSKMDFFVMINSTDPMFMYCSVSDHCAEGMVMAVNPSSDMTLSGYANAASNAESKEPASYPVGGILAAPSAMPFAGAASMSSMMSGSMSSSMMSTSMATGAMTMSTGSVAATMTATGASPAKTSEAAGGSNAAPGKAIVGAPAMLGAAAAGVAMLL